MDAGAAEEYAWFARNGEGEPHECATKIPNAFGLYDMAGNVMEWCGDWKNAYRDTTIEDYVGPIDAGGQKERVVRGGSFNLSLEYLRHSARNTPYTTLPSSATTYIGFRCVAGAIVSPQTFTGDYTVLSDSAITVLNGLDAFGAEIRSARCAFVNVQGSRRILTSVEFLIDTVCVYTYPQCTTVFTPSISPDGKWIVYGTGGEGEESGSEIYCIAFDSSGAAPRLLRHSPAYIPRWHIKPASGDTMVIYTNSAVANTDPSWRNTFTFIAPFSNGTLTGAPVELVEEGSYHGGIDAGGRYAATGFPLLKMIELHSGEARVLFTGPYNGKEAGDTSQVCNVSIAPDTVENGNVLFLDFGYTKQASTITGTRYGIHHFLFTGDFTGEHFAAYRKPDGEVSWDHPEFTNVPRYAVSSVRNQLDLRHRIYSIDLEDSLLIPLISGTDLWYPSLWVNTAVADTGGQPAEELDRDSAGYYGVPQLSEMQTLLAGKMHYFWELHDTLEVVVVGNSRAANGVDPRRFNTFIAYNMAIGGAGLKTWNELITKYIINHCPRVKLVCMSLWIGFLASPGGNVNFDQGFGSSKGYIYDRNHDFWSQGVPPGYEETVMRVPYSIPDNMAPGGLFRFSCTGWGESPPPEGPDFWDLSTTSVVENLATIENIRRLLREREIHFLVVNFPQSPDYKYTNSYGRYGPGQETAAEVISYFSALDSTNEYFYFYDAHKYGDHGFGTELAFDYDHLCTEGARELSDILNIKIMEILE
jgi:hypothetical protein